VSFIFGISRSFRGPVKLCHVASRTVAWQLTWNTKLVPELEDHTWMWQGDYIVVYVAQWLASMWPSHALPHGSEKMPNDSL
jgi:hypothetical protein